MHVWFVKWSIHLRCNHNFQQYTGFLKIKAWLLKNLMKSECYYNWNWNVQYCASFWVLISCIFNAFLQLLWEKVQGVPETVRPPEGVPGHHEPEVTLRWETACWIWLSDVIVMRNPHTGNKTTGLSRAAFPVIIMVQFLNLRIYLKENSSLRSDCLSDGEVGSERMTAGIDKTSNHLTKRPTAACLIDPLLLFSNWNHGAGVNVGTLTDFRHWPALGISAPFKIKQHCQPHMCS